MKDHTGALNLLAKTIPTKALSLLPMLLAWARRGRDLSHVYSHYVRSLLRLSEHIGNNSLSKLLSVLKYAACIVLLVNAGSLPFVWHIRVLWHISLTRLRYWTLRLKLAFASKDNRVRALIAWGESLSPVGAHPFEASTVYKRWASIDDIDVFGMHLSNSSYAKAFDSARVKLLIKCFPTWARSGGHMALGATHYHFLREVPPLVRYEVRLTIGSWDHKWLYLVARYVTRPSRRHAANGSSQSSTPSTTSDIPTPSFPVSQNGSTNVEHAVATILQTGNNKNGTGGSARATSIVEPDGAILHCTAVSQICFKWNRITVPPAVVLASEGFTKPYGDGDDVNDLSKGVCSYSRANPPPNWVESQSLRVPPHGSMDNFRDFLRGKWRDVPEGERWWEDALGGSIEAKRQANLEILESLKLGLERTRTLQ